MKSRSFIDCREFWVQGSEVQDSMLGVQDSAQPPAKKTADLIEKETSLEPNKFNNGNL
jgi:hypothetical protein